MAEFVFFSVDARPLGHEVLKRELERNGVSTQLVSAQNVFRRNLVGEIDFRSRKKVKQARIELENYIKTLRATVGQPKFIGMTFFDTRGSKEIDFFVAKALKYYFPNSTLIAGGPAFNSNPKGYLRESGADYAIGGEAEKSIVKLVKILSGREAGNIQNVEGIIYRKGRNIISAPRAKLSEEEIRNAEFVYLRDRTAAMTYTERGCPNACIFCTVPRKGKPAQLDEKTIIEGLKNLAKNPQIKSVSFLDDQFFTDQKRASRIMQAIINNGLHKRFKFDCAATIDSLLQNGKPNISLIRKIKRAGFVSLEIGTEALNNQMLRELKGGRYTKEQAISVLKALNQGKIHSRNFLLASGIETKARHFIESYYNSLVLEHKGIADFYSPGMIGATRGTAIYKRAVAENALATITGREVNAPRGNRVGFRLVMPKDAELKHLFKEKLKERNRLFDSDDISKIVKMGQTSTDPVAQKYARKLQRLSGRRETENREFDNVWLNISKRVLLEEIKKRGITPTAKNLKTFMNDPVNRKEISQQAEITLRKYIPLRRKAVSAAGIERLKIIQKMRKRTGIGMISDIRIKGARERLLK
jgi:radical SAM superfamily enzyme YgiQ (UPF0313 family)